MELLFKYMEELSHAEIISIILLLLTAADTITALMWRNKKSLGILSKTLWLGFGLNGLGALFPYIISVIPFLGSKSAVLNLFMFLWFVFFGSATTFSFVANYKLANSDSYEMLMKVAPNVLKAEIANKILKHVNKKGK